MKTRELAVIVLAAGKGTRMKSDLPKVLHPLAGMPMIGHLLCAVEGLKPQHTVLVTGHGAEQVEDFANEHGFPSRLNLVFARQTEQKGTGHAVMTAMERLKDFQGTVAIIYGDIMLNLRALPALMEVHEDNSDGLTMLTAEVQDPTGFGRLFKESGQWMSVEEKDCTDVQRAITTVNPCIFACPADKLRKLLSLLTTDNAQKEYYLTDIIALGPKHETPVHAVPVQAERAEVGVNNRSELAHMEALMQNRFRRMHMLNGVTLQDPNTVYFSTDTQIAPDVTVGPGMVFGAGVVVESGVVILPYCHLEGCTLKRGAVVGPFARIRPTTVVGEEAKVGNFVEVKNSTLGAHTKANHLSYLGDATVGEDVNVGAGTITANYNRKTKVKSRTVIGDGASLGAHTTIVAPCTVGKASTTGAGTTLRGDVEDGALVVSKAEVLVKRGYGG